MSENRKITLPEETLALFYNILQNLDIIIYHLHLLCKDEKSIHIFPYVFNNQSTNVSGYLNTLD